MAHLAMPFLEVHVHATKGMLLLCIMTCLLEGIVIKLPIVAVVVEDLHFVFGRVLLKGKLGGKCLCQKKCQIEGEQSRDGCSG
jgi:hypothetical protein